jgi:uncharacterized membrane protein
MVHFIFINGIWKGGHFWATFISDISEVVMKTLLLWILLAFLPVLTVVTSATKLPFIQDDFAKARAEAVHRKLPIFVECWAPW